MTTTGAELADQFEALNAQFMETVAAIPADAWSTKMTEDGWSVGVEAHHVVGWYGDLANMVSVLASGAAVPPGALTGLNERNARHAAADVTRTREEALAIARAESGKPAAALRALTAEQLAQSHDMGGRQMTVQQIAENVVVGHTRMHMGRIKAALES